MFEHSRIVLVAIVAAALLLGTAGFAEEARYDCTKPRDGQPSCMYTVFPQLAAGGGFSGEIFVVNQGYITENAIRLDFFTGNGLPLQLTTDEGLVSEMVFELGPGESRVIPIALDSDVATAGFGRLTFSTASSIRGSVILRPVSGGSLLSHIGLSAIVPLNNFSFGAEVDLSRGINTALALANGSFQLIAHPDPSPQGCVISLIGKGGAVVRTAVLELPLNGHTALFLNDSRLFPDLDGFQGSVSVSAGINFGLLALRVESDKPIAIANDEGPNLAAFEISSATPETPEVEPNDTVLSAQTFTLPANIEGVVSQENGADLFSVEAKAGDILTAYTLTDRGRSQLDSYLSLEREDGTLLAFNDLNRLFRRLDAFIRIRIPRDGTYILRVEDFFLGGGSDFSYRLLVHLESPAATISAPAQPLSSSDVPTSRPADSSAETGTNQLSEALSHEGRQLRFPLNASSQEKLMWQEKPTAARDR